MADCCCWCFAVCLSVVLDTMHLQFMQQQQQQRRSQVIIIPCPERALLTPSPCWPNFASFGRRRPQTRFNSEEQQQQQRALVHVLCQFILTATSHCTFLLCTLLWLLGSALGHGEDLHIYTCINLYTTDGFKQHQQQRVGSGAASSCKVRSEMEEMKRQQKNTAAQQRIWKHCPLPACLLTRLYSRKEFTAVAGPPR